MRSALTITLALGLSAALSFPAVLTAQDKQQAEDRLVEIEDEIKNREDQINQLENAAKKAEEDAALTRENLINLAATIQAKEDEATGLEASIADLTEKQREKARSLEARQQDMVELLATLERLGNRPTALALMQPTAALETVRTANLLSTLVPHIEGEAAALKTDLSELDAIRRKLNDDKIALAAAMEEMRSAEAAMKAILKRQQDSAINARQDAAEHRRNIKKLADEANNLKELIDKIITANSNRNNPEAVKRMRAEINLVNERGNLLYPARGILIERFGAKKEVGTAAGMTLQVRPNAQVVAPFDGEVIFADNFRDFGLIIIIAHGTDYHSLISGLNESYPAVGTWVMKGEPIGVMPAANGQIKPKLYLELRRKNLPINPSPWFK